MVRRIGRSATLRPMIHALSALLGAVAASTSPAAADDAAIPFTDALALVSPAPRAASRTLLRIDPAEYALATGNFGDPADGETPPWAIGAAGAAVRPWTAVRAGPDGTFSGERGTALGDALAGGWIHATVDVPAPTVMLLEASGHGSVFVNGLPRGGDPYSWGFVHLPVALQAGRNEFLFSVGRGRLSARLVPPPAPAFIAAGDVLVPDLVAGQTTDGPVGVVVVNASDEPLRGARIRVMSDLAADAAWVDLHAMPALTAKKVALPALFRSGTAGSPGRVREARVQLVNADGSELFSRGVSLRTVSASDRRNVTRTSTIDGSAQYYAVVPATAGASDPAPGILWSLHGAGVEASGQAACYAPRPEAHVVCPTNRRPFGFDWEDWGRTDFAEAFSHARRTLRHDPLRSWLTGHSMGGHGTWQIGAQFPGEFAAIAPSAGWVSFRSYVGADAAGGSASKSPAVQMLALASSASDTLLLKENWLSQGVYVLHGDADDNVPVTEARSMFRQMAALPHPDFEYFEKAGAGHWWGNECVDWPPLTSFLFRHTLPDPAQADRVRFVTVSPQVSSRRDWVRVMQQQLPFVPSRVDAQVDRAARTVRVSTRNVELLEISAPMPGADGAAGAVVEIDEDRLEIPVNDGRAHARLALRADEDGRARWFTDEAAAAGRRPSRVPADEKKPARGGPFKNAFAHGFVAVLGTQGDDAADRLLLAKARYDADQWWVRGNGRFEIIADRAFDPAEYAGRNVVLYGNRDQNAAWELVLGDDCPVEVRDGRMRGAVGEHTGDDLAAFFVRPRADCPQGQVGVIAATGAVGLRAAMRAPVFVAGVGIPDLVAFRASMLREGSPGVVEAGFFGNDWSIEYGTWMQREVPLVEPE
jgi:dienelactone hydrolase